MDYSLLEFFFVFYLFPRWFMMLGHRVQGLDLPEIGPNSLSDPLTVSQLKRDKHQQFQNDIHPSFKFHMH